MTFEIKNVGVKRDDRARMQNVWTTYILEGIGGRGVGAKRDGRDRMLEA